MYGFGIDVSSNQGSISWSSAKNAGVKFVIVRTFLGSHNDDQTPETNNQYDAKWRDFYYGAYNAGLYVQPYMLSYARDIGVAGYDQMERAKREADDVIYWYSQNELPGIRKICWWDIEAQEIGTWGTPAYILQKMQAIKAKLDAAGIEMGIYTSKSTWDSHFYDSWYETSGVHKWCAYWLDDTTVNPTYRNTLENWRNGAWAIHQYSELGSFSWHQSGHVDLDMATTEDVFVADDHDEGETYDPIPDEWDEDFSGHIVTTPDYRRPVAFLGDGSLDGVVSARDLLYRDLITFRDDEGVARDGEIYYGESPLKERWDYAYNVTDEQLIDHIAGKNTINGNMLAAGLQDV